jgi:hypothetical protein
LSPVPLGVGASIPPPTLCVNTLTDSISIPTIKANAIIEEIIIESCFEFVFVIV